MYFCNMQTLCKLLEKGVPYLALLSYFYLISFLVLNIYFKKNLEGLQGFQKVYTPSGFFKVDL